MAGEFSWRIFGDTTLACLLAPAEIPGWLRKRVMVMPGECAVVLRNGRVDEVVSQQRVFLPGAVDAVINRFKSLLSRDEQVDVLMVDVTSRDLTLPFSFTTSDMHTVEGECLVRLRVDPQAAPLLLGLIKRVSATGPVPRSSALSVQDVSERLRVEWAARILSPLLAQRTSAEYRGNPRLLEEVERESKVRLQPVLSQWGLSLEGFVINWALTEAQQQQVETNRLKLEEEAKEFQNSLRIAELRRANQVDMAHLENMQRLKTLEVTGEQEEKDLLLRYELGRTSMADDQRLSTATIDGRIHAIQVEMQRREVELRLHEKREATQIETQQATTLFESVQRAKREREESQRRHEASTLESQTAAQERITLEALQRGIDPSKLAAFYREQTYQRMADRSDDKVRAMAEAEAARHSMEAFKEAEDRERQQQQHMTGLSAHLMEAGKQNVPHTLVQGGTPDTHLLIQPPASPASASPAERREPAPPAARGTICVCGTALQPTWKVCPTCGVLVARRCPNPQCQYDVKPGWKLCPQCGTSLA